MLVSQREYHCATDASPANHLPSLLANMIERDRYCSRIGGQKMSPAEYKEFETGRK